MTGVQQSGVGRAIFRRTSETWQTRIMLGGLVGATDGGYAGNARTSVERIGLEAKWAIGNTVLTDRTASFLDRQKLAELTVRVWAGETILAKAGRTCASEIRQADGLVTICAAIAEVGRIVALVT